MLSALKTWIITILIGAVIVNLVDMILPSSKIKPYINLVVNFIFVFIVLTPIIGFFSNNVNLEDTVLKHIGQYNKEYVDSVNSLADKTGQNSLAKGYEDGLKEVLKLKLDEYGYELKDIDFKGADINSIKIEQKNNGNKDASKDIQSSESEKSEQVFKQGENQKTPNGQLRLDEDKLKDDLVKILDVSIETIEINK